MKILATSDMHGMLDGISLDGIDVAFFSGDIAPLRSITAWDAYDQLKWMNNYFYDWCMQWPNSKIVFNPGNHDFFTLIKPRFGHKIYGKNLKLKLAPNAILLVDCAIDVYGLKVYGTPWVPTISHRWAFEAEHDVLLRQFNAIPLNVDVLLVHTPPRYGLLDVSLEYGVDSQKFGSYELLEAIHAKSPKMCFCGHIHSGSHNFEDVASTKVWNVARVDESYALKYPPLVLDVS